MKKGYEDTIIKHYDEQAEMHGLEPSSTMLDSITRSMESSAIIEIVRYIAQSEASALHVLEVGCGNGYLLGLLREQFPDMILDGIDFTPAMVTLARERTVVRCNVGQGDVRDLKFPDAWCDVIISERCLINLLSIQDQTRGLGEIWRVLKTGGYLVLLEAFQDGLANLNKARTELGLSANRVPYHNAWFDKDQFCQIVQDLFELIQPNEVDPQLPASNFLSSHYFVSRVLYPAITRADIIYNTEFVSFFSFLPPNGNYSPVQLYLLKKKP